jgi:DNA-binding response OmpR family regulator
LTQNSRLRRFSPLAEVDPDLIVLALHMDHLDGFTVLEQIRRFAPGEYLAVLILTKDITAAALVRALRGGAQDFVSKPFNETEVQLRVQNLLERCSCLRERRPRPAQCSRPEFDGLSTTGLRAWRSTSRSRGSAE